MPEQLIEHNAIFDDPDFQKLSPDAKQRVMDHIDPEFAKLTPSGKAVVIQEIERSIAAAPQVLTDLNRPGETLATSTPSQIASGFAMGALRQAGKTGLAGVQWLQNMLGRPVSPTPPSLEPRNPIETAGGQMTQLAIPLAAGIATGGASVPVQAAIGGLTSGLVASSSGASPVNTEIAAGLGAAAPAIQAAGANVVSSLRKRAEEGVAKAIGPISMKEKEALSKVLPEITRQRPIAMSSEGLLKQFTRQADQANAQFDALLAKGPSLINVAKTADSIDDVIAKLTINGKFITPEDAAAADQLTQVQTEIRSLAGRTVPNAARIADVRALKQRYDSIIQGTAKNFNRTLPEASRAEAAQSGFFALRKSMIDQNPALEKAGKAAQIAITPRNILAKQELRTISGGLDRVGTIVELTGLTAAIATGRVEPAIGAAVLAALRHIIAATPSKLIPAAARTTLANALERGNVAVAVQIAAQTPAIAARWRQIAEDVAKAQQAQ